MTLTKYVSEIDDYLVKKLPDTNHATLCEIAEFFAMKSHNYATDCVLECEKIWREELNRSNKKYDDLLEMYFKELGR